MTDPPSQAMIHLSIFLLMTCQLQCLPAFLGFLLVGLLDVLRLFCPTLATWQLVPTDGYSHPLGESFTPQAGREALSAGSLGVPFCPLP